MLDLYVKKQIIKRRKQALLRLLQCLSVIALKKKSYIK